MRHDIDVDVLDQHGRVQTVHGETIVGAVNTEYGAFSLNPKAIYRWHKDKNRPELTAHELRIYPTPEPPMDDQRPRMMVWRSDWNPIVHPDLVPDDPRLATNLEANRLRQIHGQRIMSGVRDAGESFRLETERNAFNWLIITGISVLGVFGIAWSVARFVL